MKKIFLFVLVLALVLGVSSAFAIEPQFGGLVEGVTSPIGSLDARVDFGLVTAEAATGFATLRFANPTVTIDGEELEMPWDNLELKAHAVLLQLGVFANWWRPPQMVVYSGVRGGVGLLGANFNMRDEWGGGAYFDDITVDVNGTLWKLKFLLLGWDWRIPGIPNAVFTAGVGVERCWFNSLNGTYTYEWEGGSESVDIEVDPGISGWHSTLEFGVRVAIGRQKG